MKFLSFIAVGVCLLSTNFLYSQQTQVRHCACKDCKCAVDSHCGCHSDQGCNCKAGTTSCCSNEQCDNR